MSAILHVRRTSYATYHTRQETQHRGMKQTRGTSEFAIPHAEVSARGHEMRVSNDVV